MPKSKRPRPAPLLCSAVLPMAEESLYRSIKVARRPIYSLCFMAVE
ncbi:hypothetical protein QA596_04040 [Balneolales bacterium ANBcel1]|nr:hypothetical protein [Balneolales bacterium ANBcel1]